MADSELEAVIEDVERVDLSDDMTAGAGAAKAKGSPSAHCACIEHACDCSSAF